MKFIKRVLPCVYLCFALLITAVGCGRAVPNDQIITITAHDGVAFDGRLRLPPGGKAKKLVIYLNGSGPNTYDNTRSLDGQTTFNYHDLFGEQCNEAGVAYFSYNTRGVTPGTEPPLYAQLDETGYQSYTPQNEIQDVETIIRTLTDDKRLRDAKVYLLGWSAGTIIAPQVALRGQVPVDGLQAIFEVIEKL